MMYGTRSWLHAYGIGHNIFSVALCICFGAFLYRSARPVSLYFLFCAVLFLIETHFANYLRTVSEGDGSVFFIEHSQDHKMILWQTRAAIVMAAVFFVYLIRTKARVATKC